MFGVLSRQTVGAFRNGTLTRQGLMGCARPFSSKIDSEAEIDARYEAYFSKSDIDGWEIRKAMNDIHGMDMVPNPKICIAALKACRRLNDYALTVRFLEALKDKTEGVPSLYTYVMKEIQPTLTELGISSLEELGYTEPELYLQSPHDIH
ncbi:mitochondrial cytochrome c oxidase subunit Va protein [Tropilaelaps mercedesae]|uniref:Cytochrome c oxidase subunit 5A, mitochondrial n=1 Tax=Tropilaelaps mercedesae TaxID=418985 RepID=A0A1V9XHI6_9ACAR|nr:mitochondrial cytochrome c oxidase subunit Va protein [Tropilaelaps mercedesae]